MKEAPTPPTAAIVGDTEDLWVLPCIETEYVFTKTGLCLTTFLRKLRTAYAFIDSTYESDAKPHVTQKRNNALEELSDLETLLEFCQNNGYRLEKRVQA
jgi:hypothetical protein